MLAVDHEPSSPAPRRLTLADLAVWQAFERRANDDAWSSALLEAALRDAAQEVWAQPDPRGELEAVAVLAYLPFDAELQSISVSPEMRRRGVARRLLIWLVGRARSRGAERMLLEVRDSNLAARRLYLQAGFAVDGERRGYYRREDGGSEAAVLMSRELRPCREAGDAS